MAHHHEARRARDEARARVDALRLHGADAEAIAKAEAEANARESIAAKAEAAHHAGHPWPPMERPRSLSRAAWAIVKAEHASAYRSPDDSPDEADALAADRAADDDEAQQWARSAAGAKAEAAAFDECAKAAAHAGDDEAAADRAATAQAAALYAERAESNADAIRREGREALGALVTAEREAAEARARAIADSPEGILRAAVVLAHNRAEGRADAHEWNAEHEACDADAEREAEASERRDALRYAEALNRASAAKAKALNRASAAKAKAPDALRYVRDALDEARAEWRECATAAGERDGRDGYDAREANRRAGVVTMERANEIEAAAKCAALQRALALAEGAQS